LTAAGPRLACLQRDPEIVERFRRHIRMTDDVMWLPDQLLFGEAGGIDELIVEIA